MVSNILALYAMPDDGPSVCDHFYCSASAKTDRTEIYVVPREDFPRWLEVGKRRNSRGDEMTQFRPGSHVYELVTLLSFVGEYPFQSLDLLGSKRVYKALVVRLTQAERFRNSQTGEEMTCRLFTVHGVGRTKTVRLYKQALPILVWEHPRVVASVKQAGENPYEKALWRYSVGSCYVGTVSMVDINWESNRIWGAITHIAATR